MVVHHRTGDITAEENWPKRYTVAVLCFFAILICYIDRVNISVASIAMQETFGWSETTKGFVLSSFFIGYLLFQAPGGYLANRYGGKIVLGVAVVWWSLFTIITPMAAMASFPLLIAARIGMGLGEAVAFPSSYGLLGRWMPRTERTRANSLMLSGIPVGQVVGLAASGWLVARYGWPSVFYLFGAVGLIWVVVWWRKGYSSPAEHPRISPAEKAMLAKHVQVAAGGSVAVPWKKLFTAAPTWALLINQFAGTWITFMTLAWLPTYFRNTQGVSIMDAGLFSAVPWLVMFLAVNAGGWLADSMIVRGTSITRVRKIMQIVGLLVCAICLVLAANTHSVGMAVLLMCSALAGHGLMFSGYGCNGLDIAPRHASALMGVVNTVGAVPGIVGVAVTGWLVDLTGSFVAPFALTAAIAAVSAIVWALLASGEPVVD